MECFSTFSYITYYKKPSVVVGSPSYCYGAGRKFDSRLSNVHSSFHHFRADKMSTQLAVQLNTEGPALGLPPGLDICYKTNTYGKGSRKQGWPLFSFLLIITCVIVLKNIFFKSCSSFMLNLYIVAIVAVYN